MLWLEPEEAFHGMLWYQELKVTKISMSGHIMATARGNNELASLLDCNSLPMLCDRRLLQR